MVAVLKETNPGQCARVAVDRVTLDLIENGLINARTQMDAVLFRTAMSPIIREQRDGFPIITDRTGRLLAGQFGSPVQGFLDQYDGSIEEGDVFLTNDPYATGGSISHANDWLICIPIFYQGRLLNWTSMFGHMTDIGGAVPGSMPVDSREIFEEGIIIPPIKIVAAGVRQNDLLKLIMHNSRVPTWNEADLKAIIAACRIGGNRCVELAERFGVDVLTSAFEDLFDRNYNSIRKLILASIPETKISFSDYICDDALGNGPFKISCSMWREGEKIIFDFTETDAQSPGAVNFLLSEQMFKMFCGQLMVNMFDPDILLNDGFFPLMEVRIAEGSLLKPRFPAALSGRTHAMGRIFDVISGLFGTSNPDFLCAAGFSSSPHFIFSGDAQDRERFIFFQVGFGGIPGRPKGDGHDGHSLWPKFRNIPNEFVEAYFPVRISAFKVIPDSGGAGLHRGGNGIRTVYEFLCPGRISIHDDRWFTHPWGVKGGKPGKRGRKVLYRRDGTIEVLPAKVDGIAVAQGDRLDFDSWGGGGWGAPSKRPLERVLDDLANGLITAEGARAYGVILRRDGSVDEPATAELRVRMQREEEGAPLFDRGGSIEELRERCEQETGMTPPLPVESSLAAAAE